MKSMILAVLLLAAAGSAEASLATYFKVSQSAAGNVTTTSQSDPQESVNGATIWGLDTTDANNPKIRKIRVSATGAIIAETSPSSTPAPVTGTVAANQGASGPNPWPVSVSASVPLTITGDASYNNGLGGDAAAGARVFSGTYVRNSTDANWTEVLQGRQPGTVGLAVALSNEDRGSLTYTAAGVDTLHADNLALSQTANSLATRDAARPLGTAVSPYAVNLSGTVVTYLGTDLGIGASPIIANGARLTTTPIPYGIYNDFLLVFKTAATSNAITLDIQPCLCDGTALNAAANLWEGAAALTVGTSATQTAYFKWNNNMAPNLNSSQAVNVGVASFNTNIAMLGVAPCMRFGIRNGSAPNLTGTAGTDNFMIFARK